MTDEAERERALKIAEKTGELPLTLADYRRLFRSCGREFGEQVIAELPAPGGRRLGTPTDIELRRVLDEVCPAMTS
jgi:hypothetical protein